MADFKIAFRLTAGNEGGYVNDPNDNGGETYCGISFKMHPHWAGIPIVHSHLPLHNNQIIKDENLEQLVEDFYMGEFWHPIGGDAIASQELANDVYDMAVNGGVHAALELLKQS